MTVYVKIVDNEITEAGRFKSKPIGFTELSDDTLPLGYKNWKYEVVGGALSLKDTPIDPQIELERRVAIAQRTSTAIVDLDLTTVTLTAEEMRILCCRWDLINSAGWDTLETKYP